MARVLIVTSDLVDHETLGVGAELHRRGHDVRLLGHAEQYGAAAAAGLGFAALALTPAGLSPEVRALDQRPAADVALELARRPPDLVVAGPTLLTGLKVALGSDVPTAVLVTGRYADATAWARGPVRLAARLRRVRPSALWGRAARLLVTADAELDGPDDLPPNGTRTGPVVGRSRSRAREPEPLVVADGVPAPDGTEAEVTPTADADTLSRAWLYVGDGNHAGTMRALANEVPVLLAPGPLAEAVVAAGAGRLLGEAPGDAVRALLADGPHHAAAAAIGARVREARGAASAATELESLLTDAPHPSP